MLWAFTLLRVMTINVKLRYEQIFYFKWNKINNFFSICRGICKTIIKKISKNLKNVTIKDNKITILYSIIVEKIYVVQRTCTVI